MDKDEATKSPLRLAGNLLGRLRLRRREPWNWLLQNASLLLLAPGLLFHNAALMALAMLGLVAGCLRLPLPPMQFTDFRRILPWIETRIGREAAWLARPADRRKKWGTALICLGLPLTGWLLWRQDVGPIGIALAAWYLLGVRRRNIADGIDP
jgi:hypothetical protein